MVLIIKSIQFNFIKKNYKIRLLTNLLSILLIIRFIHFYYTIYRSIISITVSITNNVIYIYHFFRDTFNNLISILFYCTFKRIIGSLFKRNKRFQDIKRYFFTIIVITAYIIRSQYIKKFIKNSIFLRSSTL